MKTARAGAIMAVLLLSAALAQAQGTQLLVSNVQVQQRPFTALWDVTYDLETVGDVAVTVRLFLSTDSGATYPTLCATVTGDVGAGVLPGSGKHAVWNAGTDFPGFSSATCRLRVTADDAPNLNDFAYVAPGTFMMGSPTTELGRWDDEAQHTVTLTHGYFVSKYEVTEKRWYQVMGGASSESQLPKGNVSWDMAIQFCNALSVQEGLAPAYTIVGSNGNATWDRNANGYRLPTEAEWEYACRAGSTTAFANGSITNADCSPLDQYLDLIGWYCGNASASHDVGQRQANAWGLRDMHGNHFEWVWDGYRNDYQNLPQVDPVYDVGSGASRVFRSGGWFSLARYCRSAVRGSSSPTVNYYFAAGLRLARSAD